MSVPTSPLHFLPTARYPPPLPRHQPLPHGGSMGRSLSGQLAVVTGASSGIGWELARQIAAEGVKVGLVARRAEPLYELQKIIAEKGGTASVAVADVGSRVEAELAVASVRSQLGPVDLVIANAGVGKA